MALKGLYLLLCCAGIGVTHKLMKTLCNGPTCLHLYQDINSDGLTWNQSYKMCTDLDQELLRIGSSQSQTRVEKLLQDISKESGVWLAGQRNVDDTWRYMNGTVFSKLDSENNNQGQCLFVRLCRNGLSRYFTDECNIKGDGVQLLCQHEPNVFGKCQPQYPNYKGKCYVQTLYDGRKPNTIDWYNGETYCSQSDKQGDIAYSYLDDDTLINSIISLVDGAAQCIKLWFGVRWRPWFWIIGSGNTKYHQYIHYCNWREDKIVDNDHDVCIYLDHKKNNKWYTEDCSHQMTRYFICMNVTGTTTTTSTTTTTTTTTTTNTKSSTTITNNSDITKTNKDINNNVITVSTDSVEQTDKYESGKKYQQTTLSDVTTDIGSNQSEQQPDVDNFRLVYLIVPIVIGVIILIATIAVTVCYIRKKRQQQLDGNEDRNHDMLRMSSNSQRIVGDKLPDVITATGNNDDVSIDDDVISPYAEMSRINQQPALSTHVHEIFEQNPSGSRSDTNAITTILPSSGGRVLHYKDSPSGDLYAISDKMVIAAEKSESHKVNKNLQPYDVQRNDDLDDFEQATSSVKGDRKDEAGSSVSNDSESEHQPEAIYCLAKEISE